MLHGSSVTTMEQTIFVEFFMAPVQWEIQCVVEYTAYTRFMAMTSCAKGL